MPDRALLRSAEELVDTLADQAVRERTIFEQAWAAGYRAGFAAGDDLGYARCDASYAESWRPIAERVRRTATEPSHAELERRRAQPGGDAYTAAMARRGGRLYIGGPVDFKSGRPTLPRRREVA